MGHNTTREEHRAAIDWLNERTDENTNVFGVVINVVQIGESEPAPAFELVAQPNGWEKSVRKAISQAGPVSAREALYREFWEQALERVRAVHPDWTRARTTGQSWCDMPSGVSDVYFETVFRRDGLFVQLYFGSPNASVNTERLDALYERRAQFESALGAPAVWERMDGRKAARVELPPLTPNGLDNREKWPTMIDWLISQQERLRAALSAVGGVAIFAVS